MKTTTLIALIAAAGLMTSNVAFARHDDQPHGYNAKVAAGQKAAATQQRYAAVGPRAHDQVRRTVQVTPAVTVAKAQ